MPRDLWQELCNYDNLFLAYNKARKHKTTLDYVLDFEKDLKNNLLMLRSELLLHSYSQKPLVNFIIRDPKTRKISKSDFRDRVVHHALCNILEPFFEKGFIYDSYANRIGKGTLKAIERFDCFKRKASRNNNIKCYILKADIQKYFENVSHEVLLSILKKRVSDKRVIWLIRKILVNSSHKGIGMPLGNLTSQFFANVYLNELDQFVKHKLKAKYYIRYVDDFVIFESDKQKLELCKSSINDFLARNLKIRLHPDKSRIFCLGNSISFLGFRIFYYHRLMKRSNIRKMTNKLSAMTQLFLGSKIYYDDIYDFLEGWLAYARIADTYSLRKRLLKRFEGVFPNELSSKEIQRFLMLLKEE